MTMACDHVITIGADGVVEAMQNDAFSLAFLGRQEVRRASELTFREESQDWSIFLCQYGPSGERLPDLEIPEAHGFDTYDSARRMEVLWLNRCRQRSLDPATEEGRAVLSRIRGGFGEGFRENECTLTLQVMSAEYPA